MQISLQTSRGLQLFKTSIRNSFLCYRFPFPLRSLIPINQFCSASTDSNISTISNKKTKTTNNTPFLFTKIKSTKQSERSLPVDSILRSNLSECLEIMSNPPPDKNFNEIIGDVSLKLFLSFLGLRKLIIRLNKATTNKPLNDDDVNYHVYITNSHLYDPSIFTQFDLLTNLILKRYQDHEKEIFAQPKQFILLVKWASKFERFHENQQIWEILYQFIDSLKKQPESLIYENMRRMGTFLKILSAHKHFCRERVAKSPTNLAKMRLSEVIGIQKSVFNYLIMNGYQSSYKGLASLAYELEVNRDELVLPIIDILSDLVENVEDLDEITMSLTKIGIFVNVKHFAPLIEKIERMLLQKAKMNMLKVDQISKALSLYFWKKNNSLEQHFSVYWNNLQHNIQTNKIEGINLQGLQYMIFNITSTRELSQARASFLQECILIAVNQALIKGDLMIENHEPKEATSDYSGDGELVDHNQEDVNILEEDFQEYEQTDSKKYKDNIKVLMKILEVLSDDRILMLNYELLEKMIAIFQGNLHLIHKPEWANMVMYIANIAQKFSKKFFGFGPSHECVDATHRLFDTFTKITLQDIDFFENHKVVQTLYSLCAMGKIDQESYNLILNCLFNRNPLPASFTCLHILNSISLLKKKCSDKEIDTTQLEEFAFNRFSLGLAKFTSKEFVLLTPYLEQMSDLACAKELTSVLEAEFFKRMNSMHFKDLSYAIHYFRKTKHLSQDFMKKVTPILTQAVDLASIDNLSIVVDALIENNIDPPGFIEALEQTMIKHMIKFLTRISPNNIKQMIALFTSFSKFEFHNPKLIEIFEKLFKKYISQLDHYQLYIVLSNLLMYLSQDISLIKEILRISNQIYYNELKTKSSFKELFIVASERVYSVIFTLKLEYEHQIDLSEYPVLQEIYGYLDKRYGEKSKMKKQETKEISPYHNEIRGQLLSMYVTLKDNTVLGLHCADFLIKQNIAVMITMPNHYVGGTQKLRLPYQQKVRQLQKMGNKVVLIHYFEWEKARGTSTGKFMYLKNKIQN